MGSVLVFGRRRPNNDSIMSALVYAQLRNQLRDPDEFIPLRLGTPPAETRKLFAAWSIPELELLEAIPAPLPGEPVQRVFLVDHNEAAQSVDGLEYAEVVGVIDHHRIASFRSLVPLVFLAMPWGATATIVCHLFSAYGVEPSELQAACLLSAICTDTLLLKSPATTVADERYAAQLGKRLGIDPVDFGRQVLAFRHPERFTPEQMVAGDVRRFDLGERRLLIAKYETHDRCLALDRLSELRAAMEEQREAAVATTLVQLVVDLEREGSQVLVAGDAEPVEEALGTRVPAEGVWLDGVVSRKVQVQPRLLAVMESRAR